jgi:superfamily II DNA/RNA helicase
LDATSIVVLDEADQLLHMGFEPQVRQILQKISSQSHQTLLFSATLGRRVERVAQEWLSPQAYKIAVGRTGAASQHVQQFVHVLPHATAKDEFVVELLPALVGVGRTLVFVATRVGCERLADLVRQAQPDLALVTLHGDKHQWDRNAAVKALVKGTASVLIASDVAARGLDLPKVQTVVSLDPPKTLDGHVHRVGRAGRLSSSSKNSNGSTEPQQQHGTAHTLLTPRDQAFAAVLRNAFAREGREISPEFEALASSSRHRDNTRTKGNRTGLGFAASMKDGHDDDRGATPELSQQQHTTSYYGPNASSAPPAKRGRWS